MKSKVEEGTHFIKADQLNILRSTDTKGNNNFSKQPCSVSVVHVCNSNNHAQLNFTKFPENTPSKMQPNNSGKQAPKVDLQTMEDFRNPMKDLNNLQLEFGFETMM